MQALLDDHPGRAGCRRLADAVAHAAEEDGTRSVLERRFLTLCADHALPPPVVNATVEGLQVDFHWPHARLVVETDGHEHHGTRTAFERDRVRDERLVAAGLRVLRFTHRRVRREPEEVARSVRAALGSGA